MSQAKIPEHLAAYFEEAGRKKIYQPGETVYRQGEESNRLYVVRSGRVRAYYVSGTGKEFTFEIIEKGRIFGESSVFSQCGRPVSVEAVNRAELLECSLSQLSGCMEESPELMRLMLQLLSDTCNHLTGQLRRITLYDRYQKIASFLLEETARPDTDRGVTASSIPYTQEDLALILGMNRVTVNRVLQEWKSQGVVAVSYGRIRLLNRVFLQALLLPGC